LVDVKRGEAKQPRAHHRQSDDVGRVACGLSGEFCKRQLADVPLPVEGKAREDFVMAEGEPGMVDALRLDEPKAKIAEMIVIGGSNRQLDKRHAVHRPIQAIEVMECAKPSMPQSPAPRQSAWCGFTRGAVSQLLQSPRFLPTFQARLVSR